MAADLAGFLQSCHSQAPGFKHSLGVCFLSRYKFWKNKSIFLFNIVLADLLLVACLPAKAYHYRHNQRRSPDPPVCKTMLFMLFLNRSASIAFLIILSLDRYFNVVHLGKRNVVKILKKSPHISAIIWLLLLPLTIPTLVKTFECCNSHGRQVETIYHDITDTFREVPAASHASLRFPCFHSEAGLTHAAFTDSP